jgi:DNA-binding transcriptional regulator YiaG
VFRVKTRPTLTEFRVGGQHFSIKSLSISEKRHGSTHIVDDVPCQRYPRVLNGIPMTISPVQSRAARGLVGVSQVELARSANLSESTVRDFEKGRRMPSINNLEAIRRALEARGAIFLDENGEGPGVRLKKDAVVNGSPG